MCKKDFEKMTRSEVKATVRETFVVLARLDNPLLCKFKAEDIFPLDNNVPLMLNHIATLVFANRSSGFISGVDTRVYDKIDICAHALAHLQQTGTYFHQPENDNETT